MSLAQVWDKAKNIRLLAQKLNEGLSLEECSEALELPLAEVKRYYKEMLNSLKDQHLSDIQSVRAREIQYALEMRQSIREQWDSWTNKDGSKKAAYASLVLSYCDRIAKLQGLDAPLKTQDWTGVDYEAAVREYMEQNQVSEQEAYERVMALVEQHIEEDRQRILDNARDNPRSTGGDVRPAESVEAEGIEVGADTPEEQPKESSTDSV